MALIENTPGLCIVWVYIWWQLTMYCLKHWKAIEKRHVLSTPSCATHLLISGPQIYACTHSGSLAQNSGRYVAVGICCSLSLAEFYAVQKHKHQLNLIRGITTRSHKFLEYSATGCFIANIYTSISSGR